MSMTNSRAFPPASALGLDTGGPWHRRDPQKTRSRTFSYLLSSSVPPTCGPGGRPRNPVRLPSLTADQRPHRKTPVVSLSFSEPSLFSPGENVHISGKHHRPNSFPKQPPPSNPPPNKSSSMTPGNTYNPSRHRRSDATRLLPRHNPNDHRPIYTHFSQPIRPSPKTPPSRPPSESITSSEIWSELRPSVMRYGRGSSAREGLSVVGRPCLPGCCRTLASVAASLPLKRTELHVFLPTGDPAREAGETDAESVDEGFMDELDCKINSLRLQRVRPKSDPYH
ncbi:unnamed protein product [Gadus morhua 'NCC']